MKFFVNFLVKVEILHLSRRSIGAWEFFFKNVLILLIKRELYRFILKIPFMQTHSKNVF